LAYSNSSPLNGNRVDSILCSEIFEYFVNPVIALQGFARIIKKGDSIQII
jgi:ubiquinone/menaquinone biosynthesis C-methylase UbiE